MQASPEAFMSILGLAVLEFIYDTWSEKRHSDNKLEGKLKQLYITLEVKKDTVGQQTRMESKTVIYNT